MALNEAVMNCPGGFVRLGGKAIETLWEREGREEGRERKVKEGGGVGGRVHHLD